MGQLEALLDDAAQALIAGDLIALARLTPQIDSAAGRISGRDEAEKLATKAKRNARLLEAATRGIKAARLRFSEISNGPTLTTYNAKGQKALIAPEGAHPARRF